MEVHTVADATVFAGLFVCGRERVCSCITHCANMYTHCAARKMLLSKRKDKNRNDWSESLVQHICGCFREAPLHRLLLIVCVLVYSAGFTLLCARALALVC